MAKACSAKCAFNEGEPLSQPSHGRDDFFGEGFERGNCVNVGHIEDGVCEAHPRELFDPSDGTFDGVFAREMHCGKGRFFDRVVVSPQGLAVFFEGIDRSCWISQFRESPEKTSSDFSFTNN